MRINLSKKKKIIVIIILVVVLGGSGGYLLWRVNQDNTVSPTDSDASTCRTVCDEGATIRDAGTYGEEGVNCKDGEKGYQEGTQLMCCTPYHKVCTSTCGDGTCSSDETVAGCPQDCATCGDGVCSSTESLTSCPEDCSVCGDGTCSGSETASSCASDCVCKDLTWSSKPSGSYTPNTKFSTITITNPNSTSGDSTGVSITLNGTALEQCSTDSENCYSISTSGGSQIVSITLFKDNTNIEEDTYTLSVKLPGPSESCTATASFVIASNNVPDTGIFDGVMGKIYLGSGFIFLGLVSTQYDKISLAFNTFGERQKIFFDKRRKDAETKKRNRFERKFK